jgi:hypothetical protein
MPRLANVGFVDKVALGQVFSEFFGFPLSVSLRWHSMFVVVHVHGVRICL